MRGIPSVCSSVLHISPNTGAILKEPARGRIYSELMMLLHVASTLG
jgi:hypothetical protein